MTKFRAILSSMWGYKKNNKTSNGWLVIEDSGDILVKNIWKSDPLGNINDIVEYQINGKKVIMKNKFGDDIKLYLSSNNAKTFFTIISDEKKKLKVKSNTDDTDIKDTLQKLLDLKECGLITEDEFNSKKSELLNKL